MISQMPTNHSYPMSNSSEPLMLFQLNSFGNDETAESFVAHSASWQKSCHLKFNDIKLAKAKKKRDHTPTDEQKRPKKRKALDVQGCFFCEKSGEEDVLHEVSTFDSGIH